jgi:hypothetical protein
VNTRTCADDEQNLDARLQLSYALLVEHNVSATLSVVQRTGQPACRRSLACQVGCLWIGLRRVKGCRLQCCMLCTLGRQCFCCFNAPAPSLTLEAPWLFSVQASSTTMAALQFAAQLLLNVC